MDAEGLTCARRFAAEQLYEAAADITWTGTSTVRDLLISRADQLIHSCLCPCLTCGHLLVDHDPDDGCGACAMAMRPFRHDYQTGAN